MFPSSTNAFLVTLVVLASGYIVYTIPLCRLWWSNVSGWALYFQIGTIGIALLFVCYVIIYASCRFGFLLCNLEFEYVPWIAFLVAVTLWILMGIGVWCYREFRPEWRHELNLKNLNKKGLDQFVYRRAARNEMMMVTLKNDKVYAGIPIEAPDNEDSEWLRIIPQWSGHRDEQSNVIIDTDYSRVMEKHLPEQDYLLIAVNEITTVHPFDDKLFEEFNP